MEVINCYKSIGTGTNLKLSASVRVANHFPPPINGTVSPLLILNIAVINLTKEILK